MESKTKINRKNRKLKKAQAFLDLVKLKSNPEQGTKKASTSSSSRMEGPDPLSKTALSSQAEVESFNKPEKAENVLSNGDSSGKKQSMTPDAFIEMKKLLRERNKIAMSRPKIFLTPEEMLPFKSSDNDLKIDTPPIYAIDVQNLLLYALQGNTCNFKPRWCKLLRLTKITSVVAMYLDGVSYSDFKSDKENFKFIHEAFETHIEMVCPEAYGSTVVDEIMSVPLSISQIKKNNVQVQGHIKQQIAAKIRPREQQPFEISDGSADKISRVCLLLSSHQMKQEGYPLPVETENDMYKDFVYTKDQYADVTQESPLFALDCEMCLTDIHKNELTRVSLLSEKGEVLYDTLVKPWNPIVNYVTRYSGITKEMLNDVTVRLEDVQKKIKKLLPPDAILCGQSLNCDLLALKMFHPYVIDTSVIFNMSGYKGVKAGLRKLTGFFLNRSIQNSEKGHSSVEDSKATLDLVKLKLQKGLEFGDATINGVYFPNIQSYFLSSDQQNLSETKPQELVGSEGDAVLKDLPAEIDPPRYNSKRPYPFVSDDAVVSKRKTARFEARRIFNQNFGVYVHHSFFKLVEETGRTSCFIGMEDLISKYEKEPIDKVIVSSDKEACAAAKDAVEEKEFTWVNFQKCRYSLNENECSQEYSERIRFKLDRRVEKVMSKVKERSLVVVIMTGRCIEDQVSKAGVFVKIT